MLRAEGVSKIYMRKTGQANHFYAVKDASLELLPGQVAVLTGRSGSGKTTLLHLLSGLLTPTEGRVWLDDTDLYALDDRALSRLRNGKIAVVPQGRSAIDTLTALENVMLPGLLCGGAGDREGALRRMAALGVDHLADAMPAQLSGGELRRVAIARALNQSPDALLADEPTGDLDDENTALALSVLQDAAKREGKAVLLVSHDSEAARYADAVYRMDGGMLSATSIRV